MKSLLPWLGRALLLLYVLTVIVVLGMRYWLLPHIDQWRTPIAQAISVATNSQATIGKLSAKWHGLLPEVTISDLQIQDRQLHQLVQIPQITARIKWQSLWARQLQFSYLRIDNLQFELWGDTEKKLHLAGQAMQVETFDENNNQIANGLMAWLVQQDQIELRNAQLNWYKKGRDVMPLLINDMNGVLSFQKDKLDFNVTATPQAGLGQSVQVRGQLMRAHLDSRQLDGVLYLQLNELSPAGWRQWLDLPTDLTQATLDTQLWLQIKKNQITDVTMDARIYNGVWQTIDAGQFKARSLRVFASAPWEGFKNFSDEIPLGQRLQSGPFKLEVYGQDIQWLHSDKLAQPLDIQELVFVTQRQTQEIEGQIEIEQFVLKNQDVHADLQGSWMPKGTDLLAGEFDVLGTLNEVQLNQIYRYFPMPQVSAEVVQWLQHGLVKGVVPSASLRLQGNLYDFPYGNQTLTENANKTALFYVGGPFVDAEIDYYLPEPNEKGWPKVENASGYLMLKGNTLWVNADSAVLKPNGKDAVQAKKVYVHINDLGADEPILTVKGQTSGGANAYLGLMEHSNLGALLGKTFNHSTATGQWQVPLDMTVNLENKDDLQVKGSIIFSDNKLHLLSFLPPLEHVTGRLNFSENSAHAENIQAQWLGGPIKLKDHVGQSGQLLHIEGRAKSSVLAKHVNIDSLTKRLQGNFSYQMQVGFDKNDQFYLRGASDLKGLSATFPAPLNKSADTEMPLTLTWQAFNQDAHTLDVQLNQELTMRLVENAASGPFFSYGSISWQQPLPELPVGKKGFVIDIKQKDLDVDAWQAVMSDLQPNIAADKNQSHQGFNLKDIVSLRLKAEQVVLWDNTLQQLTYTMQQKPLADQGYSWRADISAKQVAGTVLWQSNHQEKLLGFVDAKLQRLHWNPKTHLAHEPDPLPHPTADDFELKLPNLKLRIDDLRWKEWHLGELRLEGLKQTHNPQRWQIPLLSLHTPHGDLNATGFWQLVGLQRGLKLNTQLQSDAAGQLLDYVGLKGILVDGKGAMQAQLQWYDFPWVTKLHALDATIDFDLHEGRIDQIHSRTAKLLEFLSLQSLSRLARLDFDLRGLMKNGFPFNDMKGRLALKHNRLSTDNFRVVGPAGTIVIQGETNISTEQLDLQAVVVPNVDMSGAAIAAGIALNPVVGIGAFVTQLLFKEPLAKAMTVQYQLTGPWDQFETKEIKIKIPEPAPIKH